MGPHLSIGIYPMTRIILHEISAHVHPLIIFSAEQKLVLAMGSLPMILSIP
jgi:hypothetical protein